MRLLYTATGTNDKNKDEYACHHRNKAEEKLVEGLVEHAKSIASRLSHVLLCWK